MTTTKICTKCLRDLPLSHFSSCPGKPFGVYSSCKDCKRAYRQANKDKWLPVAYEYRADNPEYDRKRKAWNALYYALRMGKIEKPEHCMVCGEWIGLKKIQAHHADYSRPLEVIWCCADCHVILDRARRKAEQQRARA